jgi:hypothetical protein
MNYLYHYTREDILQILTAGLLPSIMTGIITFGDLAIGNKLLSYDRDAVYLSDRAYVEFLYSYFGYGSILKVDVEGLELYPDNNVGNPYKAYKYYGIIPPNRIKQTDFTRRQFINER